jgi:hypothetical protein
MLQCPAEVIASECSMSKKLLEEKTGREVLHFALPNGSFCSGVIKLIRESGFKTNRTILPGQVTCASDPYLLPDLGIDDHCSSAKCILQASGDWDRIKRILYCFHK